MVGRLSYESLKEEIMKTKSETYLDSLNITAKDIEKKFTSSFLDVRGKQRSEFVEKKLNPPSFVVIFYTYIYMNKAIPTQQEYIDYYYKINDFWIKNYIGEELDEAFKGRLCRTYPSLFRDVHFYTLLKDLKVFKRVYYDLERDLTGEIDIFVQSYKGKWYGLQLRVNTENSHLFYKIKPSRKEGKTEKRYEIIDMPLELSEAKSIYTAGETIKVYYYKEVRQLLKIIEDLESI